MRSIAVVVLGLCAASVHAQDGPAWPQFHGPNGSGVSESEKPPVEFGPNKNLKWKVKAPSGLSSPIVAGDKLVITAFDDGKLYTIAYDRATGKEVWRQNAPAKKIEGFFKKGGSPAQSTPATDGARIYSFFGSCGLFCYDMAGKELWRYEMPTAVTSGNFGTGSSPVVADGLVVVVRDEIKGSKILALNATSGEVRWQKARLSPTSFTTPVVLESGTEKQVVVASHARIIAYDLKTGNEKWFVTGTASGPCATPVVADGMLYFAGWSPGADDEMKMPTFDGLLKQLDKNKDGALEQSEMAKTPFEDFFESWDTNKDGKVTRDEWDGLTKFMSEGKSTALAVKAGGEGDVTKTHVVWKKTKGVPQVLSGIVYRGQYVMAKDGGLTTAYKTSGEPVYLQERALPDGPYWASPVAANGYIYFTSYTDGAVTVLKAGASSPEVVANNPGLGETAGATPAIADDTLYLRTQGHLYAFKEKK